jgi:hypothetical protein
MQPGEEHAALPAESPEPRPLETVEKVGDGSVTLFGVEPNFRAVADGSARLLRHAILRTPHGSVPSRTPPGASRPLRNASPSSVLRLAHTRTWRLAHENREGPRP